MQARLRGKKHQDPSPISGRKDRVENRARRRKDRAIRLGAPGQSARQAAREKRQKRMIAVRRALRKLRKSFRRVFK